MSGAPKAVRSIPISQAFAVNTREVNVVIAEIDSTGIAGSFAVHLVKDGQRLASSFFFQSSEEARAIESGREDRFAHFDFQLPIAVLANGKLRVEIEPVQSTGSAEPRLSEQMGHPTLSVYLMLEPL